MRKIVYKYPIENPDSTELPWWPGSSRVVHVAYQPSVSLVWPVVWVEQPTDPETPPQIAHLVVFGTGHAFPLERHEHVGTVLTPDGGSFVWHVYLVV